MGAHKACTSTTTRIHGSDAVATSLVLAEAIKKISGRPVDLVSPGWPPPTARWASSRRCSPSGSACPQVTFASELTVDDGDGRPSAATATTASETIEATLPALVSVTDQINEPRYPSFKGIMAAKKKPVEQLGARRPRHRPRAGRPRRRVDRGRVASRSAPRAQQGQIVTDEGDGGTRLAEFLAAQKFV